MVMISGDCFWNEKINQDIQPNHLFHKQGVQSPKGLDGFPKSQSYLGRSQGLNQFTAVPSLQVALKLCRSNWSKETLCL